MNLSEFEWEPVATYRDLFSGLLDFVHFVQNDPANSTNSYWSLVRENGTGLGGFSFILGLAVCLTFIREKISDDVIQPLCQKYSLDSNTKFKIAESCWKCLFYTISSTFTIYLTVFKYHVLQTPSLTLSNWNLNAAVPCDIQLLYWFQFSFYVHSIYTVFFMDQWRKDSSLMVCHHMLTLGLLGTSYIGRFTEFGTLVLVCHDVCDIWLEMAKLFSYMKIQGGRRVPFFENMSAAAFLILSLSWFSSRVYCFPLRTILPFGSNIVHGGGSKIPFSYVTYIMGWILFFMNVYWSVLLLLLVLRIVRSQGFRDLDDPRELKTNNNLAASKTE